MTPLHDAGPDIDELVPIEPVPADAGHRGKRRRAVVLGTAFAVCLTAVGVLPVPGVRTADAPVQDVLAGTASLPVAADRMALQTVSTTQVVLPVEKFGAKGDGVTDDTAALQKALDSVPVGSVLQLRSGATYLHSDVLRVTRPGITVSGAGATVTATNELRSAFHVEAARVQVTGVTFALATSSRRFDAPPQDKIRVWGDDVVLRDVHVRGAAAAGIFIDGAARFLLDRVTVTASRADGIHITNGAIDGRVVSPVTTGTGDDGVAVVSYKADGTPCARIQISSPVVNGTSWGRGISVVGGNDVTYTDVRIRDTDAAAIYLGSEAEYDTFGSQRVLVRGGTVTGANDNPAKDHGAVLVYSGNGGTDTRDITVANLTVTGTRSSATWNVGVLAGRGTVNRVSLSGLSLIGGPGLPFFTSTPSAVRVTGMRDDGVPVTVRNGW